MKIMKFLFLSVICFSLQGCPGEGDDETPDNYFKIQNNYNEDVYVYYDVLDSELLPSSYAAMPNTKIIQNGNYEEAFRNIFFNSDKKLWILVYKKSTLDRHTWQEIKDQELYDKRYDLTLEQLKAINYEIIYDGN